MPDRLALFGDVHANEPALKAVLRAITKGGFTKGLCTGDLVMRGSEPDECVTLVRELGWPCVIGNTDRKTANRARRDPDSPKAARIGSRAWTTNQLSGTNLAYLGGLSLVERVTLRGRTVVLMHGGPDDPREAVEASTPEKELRRLVEELGSPDCVVSGHTHAPLVREAAGCLFVNPGSVGEALDGDRRPRWGWLEATKSALRAHLERVPEDLARVRTP
ncbi:MAG: metallophosphoesterase [Thermoleophilia bacterium]